MDEILARAGIFHPVEPDVASALTIRMHKVVFPRLTHFSPRATRAGSSSRGLGGRAPRILGLTWAGALGGWAMRLGHTSTTAAVKMPFGSSRLCRRSAWLTNW